MRLAGGCGPLRPRHGDWYPHRSTSVLLLVGYIARPSSPQTLGLRVPTPHPCLQLCADIALFHCFRNSLGRAICGTRWQRPRLCTTGSSLCTSSQCTHFLGRNVFAHTPSRSIVRLKAQRPTKARCNYSSHHPIRSPLGHLSLNHRRRD